MNQVLSGTVESWTRIERPPTGFVAPLVVVLVRLEDDRRAFASVAHDKVPEIGAPVQLRWQDDGRAELIDD